MTEIKIEKKKPVLPWILLALGLLAGAWFLFFDKADPNPVKTEQPVALIDVHENNNIVNDYIAYINADTNTMTLDHEYSSTALTKLTNAVEAMANEVGFDVKADVEKAKQYAADITKDPNATNHADKIKMADELLSTAIQNMQMAKYPTLNNEAADLKNTAMAIDPQVLALDQRVVIKSFFRKAAELLTKMN